MPDNSRDDLERLLETWAAKPETQLRPDMERKLESGLGAQLLPVRPLPSQGGLALIFLAIFAACAAGLIAVLDKAGFHLMSGAQIAWMTAILTGGGILFSLALARRMAPGSRPLFPGWLILSSFGAAAGFALLFPWRASHDFISEGWPCAAMELAIAVPAIAVFWLVARRGALFASAGLGAVLTGLAAFLALAPLQFQCMFQQAPHLLVWHAGTAAVLIGLGAIAGGLRRLV
ncbi:MAG TPA: NrsF family protein [Bryobacteraceae bacterium]|jgi:hypothetical protein